MKDEGEIRRKLSQIEYRYFRDEYRQYFQVLPRNCIHNHRHVQENIEQHDDLSVTVEEGDEIGLCMLGADNPEEWPGNICEEEETAKRCPFFESKHDHQSMLREYKERIADSEVLVEQYKDIAALKWALQEKSGADVDVIDRTLFQRVHFFFFSLLVKFQMWFRL